MPLEVSAGPEPPAQGASCGAEEGCRQRLYTHSASEGTRFVCVLPGGAKAESCAAGTSVKGGLAQRNRESSVQGAISADGRRVFWSTPAPGEGEIFMREAPPEAKEVTTHTALGKLSAGSTTVGSLFTAVGKASFEEGSATAELLETSTGEFLAGQPVISSKLPAGTTIVSLEGATLTLSAPATGDSAGVGILSQGPAPLEAGLQISGEGIPLGTTIEAAAAGGLTLSQPATLSKGGVALTATDECSAPELPCTTPVSAPGEALSGTSKSRWQCAAADGSVAIYSSGGELYEFHPDGEGGGITHEVAGGFRGLAGCSEDASVIYLASSEAIAGSGENSEEAEATPGEPNLYRYLASATPGEEGSYEFVGTLLDEDIVNVKAQIGPVAPEPTSRLARITPDGGALAFMSASELTGSDATDAEHGGPDMQVFVYDAATGNLRCASCLPSGARPVSSSANRGSDINPLWAAGKLSVWQNPLYASRELSSDGRRLFFESPNQLVARDTNGRTDVYQWQAPGKGTCATSSPTYSPRNEGCVDLISSGQGARDVQFRDASPSGEDVFFATEASLLPQDYGLIDIYDARVGGGLPVPPPPEPPCEGDACQDPAAAPEFESPASSAYRGPGNAGPSQGSPCAPAARRARRASARAKAMRAKSRRMARRGERGAAQGAMRKSRRLGRQARRLSGQARRCRTGAKRRASR